MKGTWDVGKELNVSQQPLNNLPCVHCIPQDLKKKKRTICEITARKTHSKVCEAPSQLSIAILQY